MKNVGIRILVIIFTVIFGAAVITIFTADRLYSMSIISKKSKIAPERSIELLDIAAKLDPINADIYFQKYKTLNNKVFQKYYAKKEKLSTLRRCINLCPSWPDYHINYAITLSTDVKSPNMQTRKLILSELRKAKDLKQASPLYKDIYDRYKVILSQK